jgi:gliding motility-associated-like protein
LVFEKKYVTILVAILMALPGYIHATHLVGGTINYKYLGNNTYGYTLTIYRDCSMPQGFDTPAQISIYQNTPNGFLTIDSRNVSIASQSILPVVFPTPCVVPPTSVCVEVAYYYDQVVLPPGGGDYIISYQRCCRNASILNVANPGSTGVTVTTTISVHANNSPKFLHPPPIYACLSDTFNFSYACVDPDGDSLVYQLSTPFDGGSVSFPNPWATQPPYIPIQWAPGFSTSQQVSTTGPMVLDPVTGLLKFKPNMTGQYVIGLAVLEYRGGQLINTTYLDQQLNILHCYLVSSVPMPPNICQGLTVQFQNASVNANKYHWDFGDLNSTGDTSQLFSPTYTFPAYGTYTITLVAINPNCSNTSQTTVHIGPLLAPTIQPQYSDCYKNNAVTFSVGGTYDPSATFNWSFGPSASVQSSTANPVQVSFSSPITQNISVTVSHFGCSEQRFSYVLFINTLASVNLQDLDCSGSNIQFFNSSTSASAYRWDFGVPNTSSDTSRVFNAFFSYPSFGVYTVTLIAYEGGCSDTLQFPLRVYPLLALNPNTPQKPQCLKNNLFELEPNGEYDDGVIFAWSINDSLFSVAEVPPKVHFPKTGTYSVALVVKENGCERQRTEWLTVSPEPKAAYRLNPYSPCDSAAVVFNAIKDSLHPAEYAWNIDKQFFSGPVASYTFLAPGTYSFMLVASDANLCRDTIKSEHEITIYSSPVARVHVTPKYASMLDPEITFIDSTAAEHVVYFYFGDDTRSKDPINLHHYQAPGTYSYSMIAINKYSCADTLYGILVIDDIGNDYVPNIFTPNNDGVNEHFFIVGKNITASKMLVYDRWGTLVCETNDALKGWDGVSKASGVPCSDGTYVYLIDVTLGESRNYKFKGTVTLQR